MFPTLVTNAVETTIDTEHSVLGLKQSLNHSFCVPHVFPQSQVRTCPFGGMYDNDHPPKVCLCDPYTLRGSLFTLPLLLAYQMLPHSTQGLKYVYSMQHGKTALVR